MAASTDGHIGRAGDSAPRVTPWPPRAPLPTPNSLPVGPLS